MGHLTVPSFNGGKNHFFFFFFNIFCFIPSPVPLVYPTNDNGVELVMGGLKLISLQ